MNIFTIPYLLRNRNFILILSLATGLIWGQGAQWTETTVLPALAIVMTLSVMGITGDTFRSLRKFITPALTGIVMNYVVLGGIILGLSKFFIHDEALWSGFVILAAVPPAVAVIPFTLFLKGDTDFSLIGTISAYLGALLITPLMVLLFIGTSFVDLPMAVGRIGGATKVHPTARAAIKLLGVKSAQELGEIAAAVGLAQNLAALRALATVGIQKGHMSLHAKNIVDSVGCPPELVDEVVRIIVSEKKIRMDRAKEVIEELQRK